MSKVLRPVRQQSGMTLDELATETGLTKSYLSKIERGRSVPSIAAALKISRALGVDVAQLFSDDPALGSLIVEKAAERSTDRHHAIAAGLLGKAMAPFLVRPSRQFTSHSHPSHPGQEFVFVHSGTVELNHDGRIVKLETGDSAYFDASVSHKLRQAGDVGAEVLIVAHYVPTRRGDVSS